MKIDLDRGVMTKRHSSGVYVHMYLDQPGVFLNDFGAEVPPEMAAAADFDVERLLKERQKRDRLAEAQAEIEHELSLPVEGGKEKVIEARGGYEILDRAMGRAIIRDNEGNDITPVPVPLQEAKVLLSKLAPKKEESNGGQKAAKAKGEADKSEAGKAQG